jgi:hypothetical protein
MDDEWEYWEVLWDHDDARNTSRNSDDRRGIRPAWRGR